MSVLPVLPCTLHDITLLSCPLVPTLIPHFLLIPQVWSRCAMRPQPLALLLLLMSQPALLLWLQACTAVSASAYGSITWQLQQ